MYSDIILAILLCFQAVFREHDRGNMASSVELVKCRLTLFYSYWQMNEVLYLNSKLYGLSAIGDGFF